MQRRQNEYVPSSYCGDGLEVIETLEKNTNRPSVLAAVASWHERRRGGRHAVIAARLREVSGTVPRAVNDNRRSGR